MVKLSTSVAWANCPDPQHKTQHVAVTAFNVDVVRGFKDGLRSSDDNSHPNSKGQAHWMARVYVAKMQTNPSKPMSQLGVVVERHRSQATHRLEVESVCQAGICTASTMLDRIFLIAW